MISTGRNKDEVDISGSTICLEVHMIERAGKAKDGSAQVELSGPSHSRATGQVQVVCPRSGPAPDSQTPYPLRERVKNALENAYFMTIFMIGVLTLLLCDFALYIPRRLNPTTTTNIRLSVCVVCLLAIIIIIIITYWLVIWR